MAKHISSKRIKSARLYTADEAAKAVDVSLPCIRNWLREGMPCLRVSRPILISGHDLRSWIEGRKKTKKRIKLAPHEFYCMRCETSKTPLGGMIDCCENNGRSLRLSAICPTCDGTMKRLSSRADVTSLTQSFDIQFNSA